MRRYGRLLLIGVACPTALLLGACHANTPPPDAASKPMARDDLVPIVRPLPLVAMAAPLVVQFDLEPPTNNGSPTLLIAVRVSGDDGLASMDLASLLRSTGVSARIALVRETDSGDVPISLMRIDEQRDGTGPLVPLAADGRISKAWLDDPDYNSLLDAGLIDQTRNYRNLGLAWAQYLAPGRYRLSIQLLDPNPEVASVPAELLVAYHRKPK